MVIRTADLETVCGYTSTLPENEQPEIAFAGKSNVGKSSLINMLLGRKSLARISSSPGKTQTINFYKINDAFYLTDLPGYGFARISAEEREKWGEMIENYLHSSRQLRAVFLLLDSRHEPQDNDIQMYEWMTWQGYAPIVLATKADKLKKTEIGPHMEQIRTALQLGNAGIVIPCSAVTGEGREKILTLIAELTGYKEELQAGTQKTRDPNKKARWKESGRQAAKKTVRNRKKKQKKNEGKRSGKGKKH